MRSLHEYLSDPLWLMMLETYEKLQDFESSWTIVVAFQYFFWKPHRAGCMEPESKLCERIRKRDLRLKCHQWKCEMPQPAHVKQWYACNIMQLWEKNSYTRFSGKSPQHLCQSRTSPAKTEPKFSETWNLAPWFFACPPTEAGTKKIFTTGKRRKKYIQ